MVAAKRAELGSFVNTVMTINKNQGNLGSPSFYSAKNFRQGKAIESKSVKNMEDISETRRIEYSLFLFLQRITPFFELLSQVNRDGVCPLSERTRRAFLFPVKSSSRSLDCAWPVTAEYL